jgi:cytochrome oxidase Cu insertion factor (SCO1/SenC/PrrC family)
MSPLFKGTKTMNTVIRTCLFLCVLFLAKPALAQLGPKDGANLPATDLNRIKIGEPAPDFTLQKQDGRNVSLSDYRGQRNVVLVFYRGHW